jgi:hypothetical protein
VSPESICRTIRAPPSPEKPYNGNGPRNVAQRLSQWAASLSLVEDKAGGRVGHALTQPLPALVPSPLYPSGHVQLYGRME